MTGEKWIEICKEAQPALETLIGVWKKYGIALSACAFGENGHNWISAHDSYHELDALGLEDDFKARDNDHNVIATLKINVPEPTKAIRDTDNITRTL